MKVGDKVSYNRNGVLLEGEVTEVDGKHYAVSVGDMTFRNVSEGEGHGQAQKKVTKGSLFKNE